MPYLISIISFKGEKSNKILKDGKSRLLVANRKSYTFNLVNFFTYAF